MLVKEAIDQLANRRPKFDNIEDAEALYLIFLYRKLLEKSKSMHDKAPVPRGHIEYLLNSDVREMERLWHDRRSLNEWKAIQKAFRGR